MSVLAVLEKVNDKDVEKVVMNYDGCIVNFESLDDFENEIYKCGLDEDEVKSFKVRKGQLSIVI